MTKTVASFKEWVSTIREDVETLETILKEGTVAKSARVFLLAGLNYLIQRMDLVPDWEASVGLVDDTMVLRVCVELASQEGLDEDLEDADQIVKVGRLLNEQKEIESYLGVEAYARLRRYCERLATQSVRGRHPEALVADADAQARLFGEIESELARLPAAPFSEPDALDRKFKSYLHHKLKEL